jgi:aminopeptidase
MDISESLEKYAELIVKVGLNLRPGQRLLIGNPSTRGAQLHTAPLVRQIAAAAYKSGASYVDVLWGDETMFRDRFLYAPRDSFTEYSTWQANAYEDFSRKGDAILTLRSNNPDLLSDQDPELIGVAQKVHLQQMHSLSQAISLNSMNWCVVAAPSPAWAVKIFPNLTSDKAQDKLWQAIFEITRVDQPDPIAAWKEHISNLLTRSRYLQAKQYSALHYRAPGTDLTVGLPKGHRWISARMTAGNGVDFTANLPTEEVFSLPHREQIDGSVRASLPLPYSGAMIEDFSLTFEKGRVVNISARKGEEVLRKLIETDEGSASLGEVALVSNSSPIARRGHLFYDPLIDENASCHLALGRAYRFTLSDGEGLSDEEFQARGGNLSLAHVDFMIGSGEMDIDGIQADGSTEAIMRQGEWAFDA